VCVCVCVSDLVLDTDPVSSSQCKAKMRRSLSRHRPTPRTNSRFRCVCASARPHYIASHTCNSTQVFGPDGQELKGQSVIVTPAKGDGKNGVVYKPTKPGTYKVHVKLGDIHIPGSVRDSATRSSADVTRVDIHCRVSRGRVDWWRRQNLRLLLDNVMCVCVVREPMMWRV
jgi:hypothetical protein